MDNTQKIKVTLTESKLRGIIKESIKKVVRESDLSFGYRKNLRDGSYAFEGNQINGKCGVLKIYFNTADTKEKEYNLSDLYFDGDSILGLTEGGKNVRIYLSGRFAHSINGLDIPGVYVNGDKVTIRCTVELKGHGALNSELTVDL